MILVARGIKWYGLYLFLILLPIITALVSRPNRITQPALVEIAVGAGFVGFSLMAMEFALISRIQPAAEPFGEDSLQLFHNIMGTAALGFVLAHPVLLFFSGYPVSCWVNPFASCANSATITAALAVYILLLLISTSIWRKQLRLRYEIWYTLHGIFALVVLSFALVHIFMIGRYTSTPIMKLAWAVYAILIFALIIRYKIYIPLKNWRRPWEVIENRAERGDARTLVLKPVGHDGWNFEAGQFAWIKTGGTPMHTGQHPISISSKGDVPPGGTVTFTIKNLGDWSGKEVPALQPGKRVWLDGPYGVFTMDRNQAMGFVLIGGGVGITPLYSMLQTMAERQDVRPVLLFYGASDLDNLTFADQLDALADSERLNLTYVPVLNNPPDGWKGETGFINAQVMEKYLPKQYKRFMYLICGPEPLMDAMEQALPVLGIPSYQIITERFDMV
jgi:predicted ferric reductase